MLMNSASAIDHFEWGTNSAGPEPVNLRMVRLRSPDRSTRRAHKPSIPNMHSALASALTAALVVLTSLGLQAAELYARPLPVASSMAVSKEAEPMRPWRDFCERFPAECAIDLSEPPVMELTASAWDKIEAVNELVNSTVQPIGDVEHWGVVDAWDFPDDGHGDCEDYQLLKRKLLAEMGFPRRAMRMTVVLDEAGAGHAVLTIRTDRGDYILDNRRQVVLAWSDTGYEYIKREGSQGPAWLALNGKEGAVAVASR